MLKYITALNLISYHLYVLKIGYHMLYISLIEGKVMNFEDNEL